MKFVCMKCESFMLFQKVEKPAEESLGVMFECPKCGGRFSMVTNPGETAMVNALGVKIGGRIDAPAPFELTRGTLKESVASQPPTGGGKPSMGEGKPSMGEVKPQEVSRTTEGVKPSTGEGKIPEGGKLQEAAQGESSGGCPFSSMMAGMGSGEAQMPLNWTSEALDRMEKVPDFIRPMVKGSVESFARKNGYHVVTPQVIDESKGDNGGMKWTPEAQQRLDNIPEFIRPMAKMELERMAGEKGLDTVTDTLMDESKSKFGQFMGT